MNVQDITVRIPQVSSLFKGYDMDQEHKDLVHWLHGYIPCSIHSQASLLGGTAPLCSDPPQPIVTATVPDTFLN